jgi:hypothetical protein
LGKQTHCQTITDGSYRPEIFLDIDAWKSMLPSGVDCIITVLNVPPITLVKLDEGELSDINAPPPTPQITGLYDGPRQNDDIAAKPGSAVMPQFPAQTAFPRQQNSPYIPGQQGAGNNEDRHSKGPARGPAKGPASRDGSQNGGVGDGNGIAIATQTKGAKLNGITGGSNRGTANKESTGSGPKQNPQVYMGKAARLSFH